MFTTTKVEYTEAIPLRKESSLVEGIFYNANDKTVVFDLQDRIYRYNNVDRVDVLKVANAESVGREYTEFKRKFGPGDNLGEYEDIEWEKVSVNTLNVSVTANRNGTVATPYITTTTTNSTFKLNVPNANYSNFKVGFVVLPGNSWSSGLTSSEVVKYHNVVALNMNDAILKVQEIAKMLDLNFKIKEVTLYFD